MVEPVADRALGGEGPPLEGAVRPQIVRECRPRRAARPHRAAAQCRQGGPGGPAKAVRDPRQHRGDEAVGRGAEPALPGRRGGEGRGRGRQPHEGRVPGHPLATSCGPRSTPSSAGRGSSAPARSTPRTGRRASRRSSGIRRSRPSSSRTCSTSPASSRAISGSKSSG